MLLKFYKIYVKRKAKNKKVLKVTFNFIKLTSEKCLPQICHGKVPSLHTFILNFSHPSLSVS